MPDPPAALSRASPAGVGLGRGAGRAARSGQCCAERGPGSAERAVLCGQRGAGSAVPVALRAVRCAQCGAGSAGGAGGAELRRWPSRTEPPRGPGGGAARRRRAPAAAAPPGARAPRYFDGQRGLPSLLPADLPAPPRRRAPRALPLAGPERCRRSAAETRPSESREAARLRLLPLGLGAAARHGPTLAAGPAIGRPPPRAAAWAGPRGWLAGGV